MDEDRPLSKRRCAAMIAEGIYDPESKDGIDFCVDRCPYDYCVVMEYKAAATATREGKADMARRLRAHRVSVDDIVLILGVAQRTVHRWLKQ